MSTPTPTPPEAPATVAAPAVKPHLKQISNWLAAFVVTVGNALPYITPDFLASLGVSEPVVHVVSSVVALALVLYKEKAKVSPTK